MSAAVAAPRSRLARLRLSQWLALSTGLLLLVALGGIVAGLASLERLSTARALLADHLDPASAAALRLSSAVAGEETGVRSYLLTGREILLEPYRTGLDERRGARETLGQLLAEPALKGLRVDIDRVDAALREWDVGYIEPTVARVRRSGRVPPDDPGVTAGQPRAVALRAELSRLQDDLLAARQGARRRLESNARSVFGLFLGFGVVLLLAVVAASATLRAVAISPLRALAEQVRHVARGEFGRSVGVDAAREVVELGDDVDGMRRRILDEVAALEEAHELLTRQAQELQRSNTELEQFAYVASHDLQEPLRKVASFCELLRQRYRGQLDDRADDYIDFAVDGARRMQELIHDLLAFSRVGRTSQPMSSVDCNAVLRAARANLASRIEETGATIEAGDLPVVRGDPGLLTLVFQNLIGNALKFRGDEPPHVWIGARAAGDSWELTCRDNGIGVDAEHAERIFAIFQRLHSRSDYEGTGIGLAMCRKIVEYHGGRIWLASDGEGPGATFRFTLPRDGAVERS